MIQIVFVVWKCMINLIFQRGRVSESFSSQSPSSNDEHGASEFSIESRRRNYFPTAPFLCKESPRVKFKFSCKKFTSWNLMICTWNFYLLFRFLKKMRNINAWLFLIRFPKEYSLIWGIDSRTLELQAPQVHILSIIHLPKNIWSRLKVRHNMKGFVLIRAVLQF